MRHITLLLALRLFISSAQQCVQTIDICVEQCECCDAGTDVKGNCEVSLVDRMEICSGDGSYVNDPTSYVLESRSIQTEQWDVTQEGDLIFPNRIDEASPRECILVAVSMHKFHFEHRITFPNQNAAKYNPTEFSGLLLHGTCGSEAPTFIPSDNPSLTPTERYLHNVDITVNCLIDFCDDHFESFYTKIFLNDENLGTLYAQTISRPNACFTFTFTGEVDMREGDFKVGVEVHSTHNGFIGYSNVFTSAQLPNENYLLIGGDNSCGAKVSYAISIY